MFKNYTFEIATTFPMGQGKNSLRTLKRRYHHFDEIFSNGCTRSGQMTISSAASDDNFIKMLFLFRWMNRPANHVIRFRWGTHERLLWTMHDIDKRSSWWSGRWCLIDDKQHQLRLHFLRPVIPRFAVLLTHWLYVGYGSHIWHVSPQHSQMWRQ